MRHVGLSNPNISSIRFRVRIRLTREQLRIYRNSNIIKTEEKISLVNVSNENPQPFARFLELVQLVTSLLRAIYVSSISNLNDCHEYASNRNNAFAFSCAFILGCFPHLIAAGVHTCSFIG